MPIECYIDYQKKLAEVWMSHADQESSEKQQKLKEFLADCKAKKIFVCVFESGDGDLVENTKELLAYNYNNQINLSNCRKQRDEAR